MKQAESATDWQHHPARTACKKFYKKYIFGTPVQEHFGSAGLSTLRNIKRLMRRSLKEIFQGKKRFRLNCGESWDDYCIFICLLKPANSHNFTLPEYFAGYRVAVYFTSLDFS